MWFGKLAIISYVFSIAALSVGWIFFNALGWELFCETGCTTGIGTQAAIEALSIGHSSAITDTEGNPLLIFGDFLAALAALALLPIFTASGGVIGDLLGSVDVFGPLSAPIQLLIRGLITFSSFCLVINLLSGREL